MKKTKILFWVFNGIFAAFMVFSAIPDIMNSPDAVKFMTALGYPLFFTPFIGVAKVLGSIAILIPGYPRIKEWAYAGLTFDLIGAAFSIIAVGTPFSQSIIMVLFLALPVLAYYFYHQKLKLEQ